MARSPTDKDYALRKNITKACTFCKSRKRKCDGQIPCGFCQKKNKAGSCSYNIVDKRSLRYSYLRVDGQSNSSPDPSTASAPAFDSDHAVHANPSVSVVTTNMSAPSLVYDHPSSTSSQDQSPSIMNNWLPSISPRILPASPPPSSSNENHFLHPLNKKITGTGNNTFTSHVTSILGNSPIATHQLFNVPPQRSPTLRSYGSDQPNTTTHNSCITDYEDGYNDNSRGAYNHIGRSSSLSLLHHSRELFKALNFNDILRHYGAISRDHLDLSKSKFADFEKDKIQVLDVPNLIPSTPMIVPLPPRAECDRLVSLFIQNANQLIYMMNDTLLETHIVEQAYQDPLALSPRKLCQLYTILAIGSLYLRSYRAEMTDLNVKYQPEDYFTSALSIMSELTNDGNLWFVEVSTLFFFYYQLTNRRNTAWLTLCQSIKAAESLGLNRKDANNSVPNKNLRLHRRKVWRSLYILDRIISVTLGKPMNITDSSWDDKSSLPIEDTKSNLRSVCENQLTKLSILSGEIHNSIYFSTNDRIDLKIVIELSKKLNDWSGNLPTQLKAQNILLQGQKMSVSGRFDSLPLLLLHLFHLNGIFLLSKHFFYFKLTKDIEAMIGTIQKNGVIYDNYDYEGSVIKLFSDSCVNASISIVKFCWYFYKHKLHPVRPYILINNIFNAGLIVGLVLLYDGIRLIESRVKKENISKWNDLLKIFHEHHKIMNVASFILKEYSANWDSVSSRLYQILTDMSTSVENLLKSSISIDLNNNESSHITVEKFNQTISTDGLDISITEYEAETIDVSLFERTLNFPETSAEVEQRISNEMDLFNSFFSGLSFREGGFSI